MNAPVTEAEKNELYRAMLQADDVFSRALRGEFDRQAGQARYQPHKWNAALRDLWARVEAATLAYRDACAPPHP